MRTRALSAHPGAGSCRARRKPWPGAGSGGDATLRKEEATQGAGVDVLLQGHAVAGVGAPGAAHETDRIEIEEQRRLAAVLAGHGVEDVRQSEGQGKDWQRAGFLTKGVPEAGRRPPGGDGRQPGSGIAHSPRSLRPAQPPAADPAPASLVQPQDESGNPLRGRQSNETSAAHLVIYSPAPGTCPVWPLSRAISWCRPRATTEPCRHYLPKPGYGHPEKTRRK